MARQSVRFELERGFGASRKELREHHQAVSQLVFAIGPDRDLTLKPNILFFLSLG